MGHTPEEICRLGVADITAIADFLGDKPFFMGESPTTVDATVYGHIANIIAPPIESPLKEHGLKQANLVKYCERMLETFYPELARAS